MSAAGRISLALRAKAERALDRLEDPQETLEYSYQRQLELLAKAQKAAAGVTAVRRRLELDMNALRREQAGLAGHAGQTASAEGKRQERQALRRKAMIDSRLTGMAARHQSLQAEEEQLTAACERLAAKVDGFRIRKETVEAACAAAEVRCRIGEIWASVFQEIGDAGTAALSPERQLHVLAQLRRAAMEATAARKRLESYIATLRQRLAKLEGQAGRVLSAGQEDLAGEASALRAATDRQLSDLATQLRSLQADEEKATAAYEQLAAKAPKADRVQEETTGGGQSPDEA